MDVYPRRFESRKTGRAGYAPACANEWVRGVCEKPRIKCADCPNRRFPPVTDEVIRWHLSGKDAEGQAFVAGVYPLLLDETCFFLAVDFDKVGWQADALAFMDACMRLQLPAALERSRSGRAARARSASEAFLFRRLETLAETKGRFSLNVALPIPFDGTGSLEVDLLCRDARLAVELDGGQHLADPVVYRRDRKKDQLLQENGYLVLRFLAEDVGKELDAVLDAILRAMSHRATVAMNPLHFVRGGRM